MGRATGRPRGMGAPARRAHGLPVGEQERQLLANVRRMGFKHAYTVGGCERDRLRGVEPKDFDIAVAGHSKEELLAAARREGKTQELVVAGQVIGARLWAPWGPTEGIEVALARTEVSTGGGRHAFAIKADPQVPIEQDLLRRDFTCNAMARDIYTGQLIDPLGGARDLQDGVLRTVSEHSFSEDPLRIMRGLARCAKDGLHPDQQTFAQMAHWAQDPKRYLRDRAHELIADHVAQAEQNLSAQEMEELAARVGAPREDLGENAGLVVLMEQGLYEPGRPLDMAAVESWSRANIDDPGRPRAVFEAATQYRWYGEVPISPERIYEELTKTLSGDHAADALEIARDSGVLVHVVPELADSIGFAQRSKFHDMTVDEHTLLVVRHACELDAPVAVRLAALLHDSGKAESAWGWMVDEDGEPVAVSAQEHASLPAERRLPDDDHLHFYARPPRRDAGGTALEAPGPSHEELGVRNLRTLMGRLAADHETTRRAEALIGEHMYRDDDDFAQLSRSAQDRRVRRFLRRVGPVADDLLLLRRCDRAGKRVNLPAGWDRDLVAFETAVAHQRERSAAVSVNDLALDGRVLRDAGFSGPAIGEVKRELLDAVVEEPELNAPARLLALAEGMRERAEAAAANSLAAKAADKRRRSEEARAAFERARASASQAS